MNNAFFDLAFFQQGEQFLTGNLFVIIFALKNHHRGNDSDYSFSALCHGAPFLQVFKVQSNKHIQKAPRAFFQWQTLCGDDDWSTHSSVLTKATSEARPLKRKDAPSGPGLQRTGVGTIDVKTGEKRYVLTGEKDKYGNDRTFESKKLAETKDAYTLVSDHGGLPIERIYADHSNRLKALANEARKELVNTETRRKDPSASKVYAAEVESLNAKLDKALKNAPLERRAQAVANYIVKQRRMANPDMEKSEKKKIRGQALEEARARVGAKKDRIPITDREWQAIQAGAISIAKLQDILNNTDVDKLRERATPKTPRLMTPTMTGRARSMLNSGYTRAEVADALGVSESTLQSSLNPKEKG